jgi:uncharacterized protein (DUF427 family)
MTERAVLIPDAEHPIEIKPNPSCVTVCVAGEVVARSRRALTLREAKYAAVQYIPREDVKMSLLERTDRRTYCPYKGECSYFSIPAGGERSVNAVWTYEEPFKAVALIAGYIAFYPDRVDEIGESPAGW